jgi:YD repeat-containing protein
MSFRTNSYSTLAGWRCVLFASSLILFFCAVLAAAQEQTSRYIYDDDGRLRAVIAPNGEAAVYEYDSAGNFTANRRLTADSLELLTFTPRSGVPGTQVVFFGVGFGAGVSSVTFSGGAVATLVGFTNNTITAIVPDGAVTGPVTINTARGTLITATPFVLQGIVLNPREVSVLDGETVQFTATVIVPGEDQEVSWSVNGIEGGSEILGTISEAGLYTPPPDPPATFIATIKVTSLAFPVLTSTATVHVRSLSDFLFTVSPGISIGKGDDFTNASAFSQGISIGKGDRFTSASFFGQGVSIGKGDSFTNTSALSRGVSVSKGTGFANPTFSPMVMLIKGPVISAVSPGTIQQGSDVITVTLSGSNFSGANSVRLFNLDGNETFGVTTSNINVSGNGTSLTFNLSFQALGQVGRRIIVVATPTAHSVRSDVIVNTIQITAP